MSEAKVFTIIDHQVTSYSQDTLALIDSPVFTLVDGADEGGAELNGREYIASNSGGFALDRILEISSFAADLTDHVNLTISPSQLNIRDPEFFAPYTPGMQTFCSANGLLYKLVGTSHVGSHPDLGDLKIVELQADGTVLRTIAFPVPSTRWLVGAYGETNGMPCLTAHPDGTKLYAIASTPDPSVPAGPGVGDGGWMDTIFEVDIAAGTIVQLPITDDYLEHSTSVDQKTIDFITANLPEDAANYYQYTIGYFRGLGVLPTGELLLTGTDEATIIKIKTDGTITGIFSPYDAPYSSYDNAFYGAPDQMVVIRDKVFLAGSFSIYVDPDYLEGSHFIMKLDASSTDPIIYFPHGGPEAWVALDDAVYFDCLWGSETSLADKRFYFIEETFPEQIRAYDPDTMTPVHGPHDVDVTSACWVEGGCDLEDGHEYLLSRNNITSGALSLIRVHQDDLSGLSAPVNTTQPSIRGTRSVIGGQAFCAAPDTGLLYGYVATGIEQGYNTGEHDLNDLKIVEFQPDGTIVRTFDFPAPSSAEGGGGLITTPHNLYAGEDGVSVPCMAITPDGTTLYVVASRPEFRTASGTDIYWTTIFKFDIVSGVGTRWRTDQEANGYAELLPDLTADLQQFIIDNWPEEEAYGAYYFYGISGLACFSNGDLLVASAFSPTLVRLDPDGNVIQLLALTNSAQYKEDYPHYPSTGYFSDGLGPICIIDNWAMVANGPNTEFRIDDGTETDTGVTIWSGSGTNQWGVIAVDASKDPGTYPIVLLPISGPPYVTTEERVFSMWAPRSTETPGPPPISGESNWGRIPT